MGNAAALRAEDQATDELTARQKADWERDGYLILPQFFGADVIDPINALIESLADPARRPPGVGERVVVDQIGRAHV